MGNKIFMELIKNTLIILVPLCIAIVSGIFNVYQYLENKKLKKYATEKDLKRRRASLEKLRDEHKTNRRMLSRVGEIEKDRIDFNYREKCILAEIELLEKVLKIKNNQGG